jgi:hypothetical protein
MYIDILALYEKKDLELDTFVFLILKNKLILILKVLVKNQEWQCFNFMSFGQ